MQPLTTPLCFPSWRPQILNCIDQYSRPSLLQNTNLHCTSKNSFIHCFYTTTLHYYEKKIVLPIPSLHVYLFIYLFFFFQTFTIPSLISLIYIYIYILICYGLYSLKRHDRNKGSLFFFFFFFFFLDF